MLPRHSLCSPDGREQMVWKGFPPIEYWISRSADALVGQQNGTVNRAAGVKRFINLLPTSVHWCGRAGLSPPLVVPESLLSIAQRPKQQLNMVNANAGQTASCRRGDGCSAS